MMSIETMVNEFKSMPEHAPGVEFDTSLGKHIRHVDFDYLNYQIYMIEKLRIDPEYINRLKVIFTAEDLGDDPNKFGAFAWEDDGSMPRDQESFHIRVKIPVDIGSLEASHIATNSLIHETKHFADYLNGTYSYATGKLGQIAARRIYRITPWEIAARKAEHDFRTNPHTKQLNLVRVFEPYKAV